MYQRKYKNKKVYVDGMVFDSLKEYKRFKELSLLERAGKVQNLQRQVKFVLIPTQREPSTEIYLRGAKKGQPKEGKVIEKECYYKADFVYFVNGEKVVEDTKGFRTEEYKIKRKLMLYLHGVKIYET